MKNRVGEINNLITRIAMNNRDISSSQIARARAIYQDDPRPLAEIEKELLEYSEQISQHAKRAGVEMAPTYIAESTPEEGKAVEIADKQNKNKSTYYNVEQKGNFEEQPISTIPFDSPVEAEQNPPYESIMVDYTGDIGITPIGEHGFVPPSYVPDSTFPSKTPSSSDLDMMFAQSVPTKTNEKPKQYVKNNSNKEAGFSSSIAILATAGMLSIITIALAIAILIF